MAKTPDTAIVSNHSGTMGQQRSPKNDDADDAGEVSARERRQGMRLALLLLLTPGLIAAKLELLQPQPLAVMHNTYAQHSRESPSLVVGLSLGLRRVTPARVIARPSAATSYGARCCRVEEHRLVVVTPACRDSKNPPPPAPPHHAGARAPRHARARVRV